MLSEKIFGNLNSMEKLLRRICNLQEILKNGQKHGMDDISYKDTLYAFHEILMSLDKKVKETKEIFKNEENKNRYKYHTMYRFMRSHADKFLRKKYKFDAECWKNMYDTVTEEYKIKSFMETKTDVEEQYGKEIYKMDDTTIPDKDPTILKTDAIDAKVCMEYIKQSISNREISLAPSVNEFNFRIHNGVIIDCVTFLKVSVFNNIANHFGVEPKSVIMALENAGYLKYSNDKDHILVHQLPGIQKKIDKAILEEYGKVDYYPTILQEHQYSYYGLELTR